MEESEGLTRWKAQQKRFPFLQRSIRIPNDEEITDTMQKIHANPRCFGTLGAALQTGDLLSITNREAYTKLATSVVTKKLQGTHLTFDGIPNAHTAGLRVVHHRSILLEGVLGNLAAYTVGTPIIVLVDGNNLLRDSRGVVSNSRAFALASFNHLIGREGLTPREFSQEMKDLGSSLVSYVNKGIPLGIAPSGGRDRTGRNFGTSGGIRTLFEGYKARLQKEGKDITFPAWAKEVGIGALYVTMNYNPTIQRQAKALFWKDRGIEKLPGSDTQTMQQEIFSPPTKAHVYFGTPVRTTHPHPKQGSQDILDRVRIDAWSHGYVFAGSVAADMVVGAETISEGLKRASRFPWDAQHKDDVQQILEDIQAAYQTTTMTVPGFEVRHTLTDDEQTELAGITAYLHAADAYNFSQTTQTNPLNQLHKTRKGITFSAANKDKPIAYEVQ